MSTPNTMQKNRWKTLDIIKAMAVPAMIIVHNSVWWLSYHRSEIPNALDSWSFILGAAGSLVMLIPATAGGALYFYLRQDRDEVLPNFSVILQRAAFLCVIGFCMNTLAFGTQHVLQWNVLQFFSLSMVVVYVFLRFSTTYVLSAFAAVALFTAPLLRSLLEPYEGNYLAAILVGDASGAHIWPFFPWFSLLVVGFLLTKLLHNKSCIQIKAFCMLGVGSVLVITAYNLQELLPRVNFSSLWGATTFQPHTIHVLGLIGLALLLFSTIHTLFDNRFIRPYGFVHAMSAGLFYAYVTHMIIGHQIQVVLIEYREINLLWASIVFQLFLAYLVGVLTIHFKQKSLDKQREIKKTD